MGTCRNHKTVNMNKKCKSNVFSVRLCRKPFVCLPPKRFASHLGFTFAPVQHGGQGGIYTASVGCVAAFLCSGCFPHAKSTPPVEDLLAKSTAVRFNRVYWNTGSREQKSIGSRDSKIAPELFKKSQVISYSPKEKPSDSAQWAIHVWYEGISEDTDTVPFFWYYPDKHLLEYRDKKDVWLKTSPEFDNFFNKNIKYQALKS
jgi:hypothetical protein